MSVRSRAGAENLRRAPRRRAPRGRAPRQRARRPRARRGLRSRAVCFLAGFDRQTSRRTTVPPSSVSPLRRRIPSRTSRRRRRRPRDGGANADARSRSRAAASASAGGVHRSASEPQTACSPPRRARGRSRIHRAESVVFPRPSKRRAPSRVDSPLEPRFARSAGAEHRRLGANVFESFAVHPRVPPRLGQDVPRDAPMSLDARSRFSEASRSAADSTSSNASSAASSTRGGTDPTRPRRTLYTPTARPSSASSARSATKTARAGVLAESPIGSRLSPSWRPIDVGASGVGFGARRRRIFPRVVRGDDPRGHLRAGGREFAAKMIALALVFRLERHQVLLRARQTGGVGRRGDGRRRRESSRLVRGGGAVSASAAFAASRSRPRRNSAVKEVRTPRPGAPLSPRRTARATRSPRRSRAMSDSTAFARRVSCAASLTSTEARRRRSVSNS